MGPLPVVLPEILLPLLPGALPVEPLLQLLPLLLGPLPVVLPEILLLLLGPLPVEMLPVEILLLPGPPVETPLPVEILPLPLGAVVVPVETPLPVEILPLPLGAVAEPLPLGATVVAPLVGLLPLPLGGATVAPQQHPLGPTVVVVVVVTDHDSVTRFSKIEQHLILDFTLILHLTVNFASFIQTKK